MSRENCRLCASNKLELLYNYPTCTVARCSECSLVQVGEQASRDELIDMYDQKYFKRGKYTEDGAQRREQERRVKLLLDCGLPKGAKVLDAGCATGGFIRHAKKHFDMWGNDISTFAIEEAKEINPEIADQLSAGLIEEQGFEKHSFDAITLWDVIEHLEDPEQVVSQLRKYLKPGGHILLSTPNIGAFTAKVMGKRWAFMTPPEHLCLFSKKTLTQLFEKSGFQVSHWDTRGKWVNAGFFLYKLARVFPKLVPQSIVKGLRSSSAGKILFYVPSGDIQYVGAQLNA